MTQDTTRQTPLEDASRTSTPQSTGRESLREPYGPDEHTGAPGGAQGGLSQRHPLQGREGRPAPSRGGVAPYGGYANPFELMQRMSDDMDRIFESFGFGPGLIGRGRGARALAPFAGLGSLAGMAGGDGMMTLWTPRIEVFEREGRLVVEADLPGVRKEDVSVEIEQDAIVIEGQRRQERESGERGYFHSERSYGSFQRTIALPEGADADNARARFRDGVLEIEVPIETRRRGRRLEIQDAQGGSAEGGRTFEGRAAASSTTGTSSDSTSGSGTGGVKGQASSSTGVAGGGSSGGSAGSV